MKVLCEQQDQPISHVFHIADIHIRLFKRHDEYKEVFEGFFKQLREFQQIKTSIIVVVGDILHSKTELTPECVQLTRWFFRNLSGILPTFVICGNHDTNLNNQNRLDSLTPLLDNLPQCHYLKETRHYQYNNIAFGVTTVKENKILPALGGEDLPAGLTQIALFMGPFTNLKLMLV